MDQLPRLVKRELTCLLLVTCNYVVSVWRGFLFLWVLGMGYVILLWHSLGLLYNYFAYDLVYRYRIQIYAVTLERKFVKCETAFSDGILIPFSFLTNKAIRALLPAKTQISLFVFKMFA